MRLASFSRTARNSCHCPAKRLEREPAVEKIAGSLVKQRQLARFHLLEIHSAAASRQPCDPRRSPIQPQSAAISRLMSEGLPAKADEPA